MQAGVLIKQRNNVFLQKSNQPRAEQILKFAVKKGRGDLNSTIGMDWTEELGALELASTACVGVTEDISSFRKSLLML